MGSRPLSVVIVGAAGVAGRELVRVLETRTLKVAKAMFLDVPEVVGEEIEFFGESFSVGEATPAALGKVDVVFVMPGKAASLPIVEAAKSAARFVIDASDVSRKDPSALLVFPGVNEDILRGAAPAPVPVAIPAPNVAQLAVALLPIQRKYGHVRLHVVSLEAVSGMGQEGIEELSSQSVALLSGGEPELHVLPHRVAFNLVPQVGSFDERGSTEAERGMVEQLGRLFRDVPPKLSVACVVAPIFYGSMQIVFVSTEQKLAAAEARDLLRNAAGIKVLDDIKNGVYPMPILSVGDDHLHVGRFRETPNGVSFVTVADSVYWGVAAPMVRVAELLLARAEIGAETT